jgi:hypothetical protein
MLIFPGGPLSDEKNPHLDETEAARIDGSAAARLDETDAGDWARSTAGAARSPVVPAASPEREVLGDPLDSGTAAAPAAASSTDASHAATVGSHAATTAPRHGDANTGKGVAEVVNPTVEDEYWRANYATRPYAAGRAYQELAPAYRYGWESRAARPESRWNEVEPDLERGWVHARGTSTLGWNEVHMAVEEAWVRVDERLAGRPGQGPRRSRR